VHVPVGGQCGTLITQPSRARHYVLLPTKTSRLWTQLWGMSAVRLRAGSQVSFTRWRDSLSRLTLVAVILSSVSHALIALSHRLWISLSVCIRSSSKSTITLSHLRTHMRWVASESKIWRRCLAPRFGVRCAMFSLPLGSSWFSSGGSVMAPHPRRILSVLLMARALCRRARAAFLSWQSTSLSRHLSSYRSYHGVYQP
jgi:hypothetical protein